MVQEGLKKGQKLLAISSPMQSGAAGEMWQVTDRPSLRFVQDAVRMTRVSSITLDLTREATFSSARISEDAKTSLMDSVEGEEIFTAQTWDVDCSSVNVVTS